MLVAKCRFIRSPLRPGHHCALDSGLRKRRAEGTVERLATEGAERAPEVITVVKANAYGHGAEQGALALEEAGADLLACADIEEGAL